ncbi:MAG: hypothetical protein ACE5M4_06530 [Anaerolineales bacterium]
MATSLKGMLKDFFDPPDRLDSRGRRHRTFWIGAMYVIGAFHWALFFDLGRIKFNVHDWGLVAHYLLGLQQALTTGQLPLHVFPATDFTVTERFLANPEIALSPQMLLVSLMDLGPFVLANTLFLYSVGFVGLYALAKRFKLSAFSFILLFLLLVFNGHLTAHLGVGHSMWLAYFLTPFVVLLIADAADRGASWRWPVLVSLALFAILLQGAFHFVLWSMLQLTLLAVTASFLRRPATVAVILTAALSAFRFIPAIFEFTASEWTFIGGFRSVGDMITGLASLKTPIMAAVAHFGPPEWWEVDYYVGYIGLGFLVVFGIIYWLRAENGPEARSLRVLAPALIILTFLSLDIVFRAIANLPFPFIGTERVSSRFFILPFLFLVLFAVVGLERCLDAQRLGNGTRLLLVAGLIAIVLDLWQHSRVWRPSAAQLGFEVYSPNLLVFIENRPDPAYHNALIAGAAITLIALAYSVWRLLRAPKQMTASIEVIEQ